MTRGVRADSWAVAAELRAYALRRWVANQRLGLESFAAYWKADARYRSGQAVLMLDSRCWGRLKA